MDSADVLHNALGSSAAGIVARVVTHPLDTAKARLQAHDSYRGPLEALVKIFQTEGIRGWYRGFPAVLIGGTPGTMLYLCGYDIFQQKLSLFLPKQREFVGHLGAGMLAETVACLIYVPVDVVKERMQVQSVNSSTTAAAAAANELRYRNSWDALRQIARTEGLRGVYKGYGATLASFGPFSALYFLFYERFKSWARTVNQQESSDLPFLNLVLCSSGAGALASFLTSPLDMAKLRLQIQRGKLTDASKTDATYRGVVDCLKVAYREGGVQGLFRGAGARVLHFAPAMTVTMSCYETFRSFFARSLSGTSQTVW